MIRNAFLLVSAVLLLAVSATAGELVVNGGFTTGDLSGWTAGTYFQWAVNTPLPSDPGAPSVTDFSASTGCFGGPICNDPVSGSSISQILTTEPSDTYTLSFYYDAGWVGDGALALMGDQYTELDVFWDNLAVPLAQIVNAQANRWNEYTFTGLTTSGSSALLEFTGRQDPSALHLTGISVMDRASLNEQAETPEPVSSALVGAGLLGVGLIGTILRRRV